MRRLVAFVLDRPKRTVAAWGMLLLFATAFALQLPNVVEGSSDSIADSESGRVAAEMKLRFGPGSPYLFLAIVESRDLRAEDAGFAARIGAVAAALGAVPGVRSVEHAWNTGAAQLIGRNGTSALLLVRPAVDSFFEAENLTRALRDAARRTEAAAEVSVTVTGMPALFHDLNRTSAADLLSAERAGVPLTLAILLLVFRAPLAAALPMLVAVIAVALASAGLYLFSGRFPVSVFAQNAVAMIGLGVGVDYALFMVSEFRAGLARGRQPRDAAIEAAVVAGHAVLVSGIAVATGFIALFLVKAPFLHGIAIGGLMVVAGAVAATLTLLPLLLERFAHWVNWPHRRIHVPLAGSAPRGPWAIWARAVMRRPWSCCLAGIAIAAAIAAPAMRMTPVNAGVSDLPQESEARRGFHLLEREFQPGWMGPVALLFETPAGRSFADAGARRAVQAIARRLVQDPRVAEIHGAAGTQISPDGTAALLVVVPRRGPDSAEAFAFVESLRSEHWPEAAQADLSVRVGGPTAMIADFDAELFGSLWRVIPAVLAVTFVVLLAAFRSVLIPLKAIFVNLLSVLAAYGFLVLLFQTGAGAEILGIEPPGGLSSLVVLMLFTILFGLSMDYEVFLLRQIQLEYAKTGDNRLAVGAGLERSATLITSAAAIMVALFGSFGFTQIVATREFGLGLAFAVALDATLIRLLVVPALLELMGRANWWWPVAKPSTAHFGGGNFPASAGTPPGR